MKKRDVGVFVVSIAASLLTLILERLIGIGWDYHPDCVTYASRSILVSQELIHGDPLYIANNFYYILVAALSESVPAITAINILLFAITNLSLLRVHFRYVSENKSTLLIVLLYLLNPYRLHLSTTILKDTLIIFLLSQALYLKRLWLFSAFLMILVRIASIAYLFPVLLSKNPYHRGILMLLYASSLAFIFLYTSVGETMSLLTVSDLVFRDFDTVPTFIDYGVYGAIFRAIIWPYLAVTGLFAALSPAPQYIALSIGSLMVVMYGFKINKKVFPVLESFLVLSFFASIVPSFTAYIRYVYPVLFLSPIISLVHGARRFR